MKRVGIRSIQAIPILLGLTTATPSYAQLEEIIVTAQKREEGLRDVPISIMVTSGEDLVKMQVSGTEDLADSLPNVTVTKGSVSNSIYMRGVGSGVNGGFEQAVATFVDGVYHGRSRYSQSTIVDIEQLEVLRGPQTIYFGNNAIGGAFSVTTKKPDLEAWDGYALTSYEFIGNEPVVEGAVGGPLVDGVFGVRLAARYSDLDGFIENNGSKEDNPQIEDHFTRLTALWQMSEDWTATFKAEYGNQETVAPFTQQVTNCPPPAPFTPAGPCLLTLASNAEDDFDYERTSAPGERGDIEASEFALRFERDNSEGLGFVALGSYSRYDYFLSADSDGVADDFFTFNAPETFEQTALELRLLSPADSKLEYIFGAYFLNSEADIGARLNFPGLTPILAGPLAPLAPFAPLGNDILLAQEEDAYSVFGSVTWPFTDRLSVTLGLRYTDSEKDAVQSAQNVTSNDLYGESVTPLPDALQGFAGLLTATTLHSNNAEVTDDDVLPSAVLRYEYSDNASFYAKYTEGFKAGGFDAVELSGDPSRLTYDPETVKAYEVGMKSIWLDQTLSLNLSLFRSEYTDLQQGVAQFTETAAFITVTNVGGLVSQGAEMELLWQPGEHWRFGTDLAYLDAKYEDYDDAGCTALQALAAPGGCAQDLSGESPPFAAEFTGNFRIGYENAINESLRFSGDLILKFSSEYDVIGDKDPVTRQDAWEKVDLRLAIADIDSRWEIAFVGKNLFDEKTRSFANDLVGGAGSHTAVIQRGRTLALQARFNW